MGYANKIKFLEGEIDRYTVMMDALLEEPSPNIDLMRDYLGKVETVKTELVALREKFKEELDAFREEEEARREEEAVLLLKQKEKETQRRLENIKERKGKNHSYLLEVRLHFII